MSVQWDDSEVEDDVSSMFSNSPNAVKPGMHRQFSTDSDAVEDVDGDMSSFYGAHRAHAPSQPPALATHFRDVPVQFVPEVRGDAGAASKRAIIRAIQQDSMQQLTMRCQAVLVRGASGSYFVYHVEITSDYYKQKWVVCKRYSEFHRLRKKLLEKLAMHKKNRACKSCGLVGRHLKDVGFPKRVVLFKDPSALVAKRTSGLEQFIAEVCAYMSGDSDFDVCAEINAARFFVKEFLQFPLDHECQHVRAIRQLKYVDPRDVQVDTETCPICLCEWNELDGNQLVLSPCGHFFHEHCINEWYRTRFDCPMCRTIAGQDLAQMA